MKLLGKIWEEENLSLLKTEIMDYTTQAVNV